MKDVSEGKINDGSVGLKSKIHSVKNIDGQENKTGKGISQNVVKNTNMKNILVFYLIKKR